MSSHGIIDAVLAEDELHLRHALSLAEGGRLGAHPNPIVGAVIVRDGRVLGEGFHRRFGEAHAERAALEDCRERGEDPAGATMYVTLEPCTHTGKQPPCAPAIGEAGIARVVIAAEDPSREASGAVRALRAAGIEVEVAQGPLAREARLAVQPFRKHAVTGLPHVVLKLALSLDGRTAAESGDSRWISGPESRTLVHRWRAEADAVCVGSGSALSDDPLLTARDSEVERQPARVVFDSRARLPLDSALANTAEEEAPVVLVCGPGADPGRLEALRERGIEVEVIEGDGPERLSGGLEALGRRGIAGMLCEGGATLAASLLEAGEVDELRVFVAPVLIGGSGAHKIAQPGATSMSEALRLADPSWEQVGEDMLLRARLREW